MYESCTEPLHSQCNKMNSNLPTLLLPSVIQSLEGPYSLKTDEYLDFVAIPTLTCVFYFYFLQT